VFPPLPRPARGRRALLLAGLSVATAVPLTAAPVATEPASALTGSSSRPTPERRASSWIPKNVTHHARWRLAKLPRDLHEGSIDDALWRIRLAHLGDRVFLTFHRQNPARGYFILRRERGHVVLTRWDQEKTVTVPDTVDATTWKVVKETHRLDALPESYLTTHFTRAEEWFHQGFLPARLSTVQELLRDAPDGRFATLGPEASEGGDRYHFLVRHGREVTVLGPDGARSTLSLDQPGDWNRDDAGLLGPGRAVALDINAVAHRFSQPRPASPATAVNLARVATVRDGDAIALYDRGGADPRFVLKRHPNGTALYDRNEGWNVVTLAPVGHGRDADRGWANIRATVARAGLGQASRVRYVTGRPTEGSAIANPGPRTGIGTAIPMPPFLLG
jgi:hypothetical protein